MIKLFLYLFTLILLVNCSVDTRSGIWENVNETKSAKKISEKTFEHNLSTSFKECVEIQIVFPA